MEDMISTMNHKGIVMEVLAKEAYAIMNLMNRIDHEIVDTIEMILACKGRIIITGVGKSGIIARKITATLTSTGTPSLFLHPSEGLHGDLGMVIGSDIVIALSKSGETEEILNIIPSIKRIGAKLIAFVGNSLSTLGRSADKVISIGSVKEACPLGLAPTTSTTLMLTLGDAIAIALLKARNFSWEDFAVRHPGGTLGKKLLLTVNDIINITQRNPTLSYSASIKEAIFSMTESGLGGTSVVDQEGKLIGIMTDGDIRRAFGKGLNAIDASVTKLFNKKPTFVKKEILAVDALNIMECKKIDVLPVVNDVNEPIAMIHLHDITRLGL